VQQVIDRLKNSTTTLVSPDYWTVGTGSVNQMLAEQKLSSLQERRKHLRIVFLFKVIEVEWSVPATPPENYLIGLRDYHSDRSVRAGENFQENHQQHP